MRQQTSSIERLRNLPAVFRGADLTVRFQWTSKTASQYLFLWKRRGLVSPLGGHSDVFANLLTQPHPDWERALLTAPHWWAATPQDMQDWATACQTFGLPNTSLTQWAVASRGHTTR